MLVRGVRLGVWGVILVVCVCVGVGSVVLCRCVCVCVCDLLICLQEGPGDDADGAVENPAAADASTRGRKRPAARAVSLYI